MVCIEVEWEPDGRWIAEAVGYPGVMVYGRTIEEAKHLAEALLKRVLAEGELSKCGASDSETTVLDACNLLNLIEAVEYLALESGAQIAWLEEQGFDADELALQFDDVYRVADQLADCRRLPVAVLPVLDSINATFEYMNGNPELYIDEALENLPEWERIRSLARAALEHIRKG